MTWGTMTLAIWVELDPRLPVRVSYVIGRMRGFIGKKATLAVVSREIGADASLTLRRADDLIEAARSSQPMRPRTCWSSDEIKRGKAALKQPFLQKLADHGLEVGDVVSLLRDDEVELAKFARARLAGANQAEASRAAGWNKNHHLDDVLVNKIRARKYKGAFLEQSWTPREQIVKKWTRGATKGYSRMRKGYGGYLINKAGDDLKASWALRKDHIGAATVLRTSRQMLVISHRIAALFWDMVMRREILELSELAAAEYESAVKAITLVDWRVVRAEDREYAVRIYWKVPASSGIGVSQRSTLVGEELASSFDIPLDRV